jgi:hypothetical protein
MYPVGYHLAQSLHARLRRQAQRDARARASRQTRRGGKGQPAPGPAYTAQTSRR